MSSLGSASTYPVLLRGALLLFVTFGALGCNGSKANSGAGAEASTGNVSQSDYASAAPEPDSDQQRQESVTVSLDYGIVYVRVPRSYKFDHFKASDRTFNGVEVGDPFDPSFADTLPEVSRRLGFFTSGGQLVWRHSDGTQTIIFDCKNGMPAEGVVPPLQNGDDVCQPAEPSVSFDGKKVAFAVYHGEGDKHRKMGTHNTGQVWYMKTPSWAGIYIYNFETRKLTHWTHEEGVWDTAPIWIPGGKMMFTSTRSNVYRRHTFPLGNHFRGYPILQLWMANQDGTGANNIGNQSQDDVLHPIVHSSGRVLYSIHEIPFARYWNRHGVADARGDSVKGNVWWIDSVDLRGGDLNGHFGTHNFMRKSAKGSGDKTFRLPLRAMHFMGELSNGDICVDIYYRSVDMGAGNFLCWPTEGSDLSPLGHEGYYPLGMPDDIYIGIAGQAGDAYGTRVRDPAGAPGGKIMFSGAFGSCSWPFPKGDASIIVDYAKKRINGEPGGKTCDFGIYVKDPLPTDWDPFVNTKNYDESTEIVDSPKWHEIMPKPIVPYKSIYGIPEPKQPALPHVPGNDKSYGIFASTNAYKGNLRTEFGWNGPHDGRWCHFQGCVLQSPLFIAHQRGKNYDNINPDKLKYIRFWQVVPLDHPVDRGVNKGRTLAELWGQKLILMGDVPIQSDGSFKAKLPADVPFLMSGVDEQGRSIARHQHVMAMRPGEKQICSGCHLHAITDTKDAKYPFSATIAASKPAVPPKIRWVREKRRPEWNRDIYPMLKKNCSSCHNSKNSSPEPNFDESSEQLYVDLTNYNTAFRYTRSLFPPGARLGDGQKAAAPWVTRYINGLFSRESLLYWKAAGKRLDGRTDDSVDNDFDFGRDHKSYLTDAQLRILSDWIEGGLYCDTSAHKCGTR